MAAPDPTTGKIAPGPSCNSCKFGIPRDANSVACLRYPPVYPNVPILPVTMWCGEYSQGQPPNVPLKDLLK